MVELSAAEKKADFQNKTVEKMKQDRYKQTTLDSLFEVTRKAMDQNGLASASSNGILTNAEINQDIALRAKLQSNLPVPSRVICSPDAPMASVSINALRPGRQKNGDTNRLYASGTNNLSRQRFQESSMSKSAFGMSKSAFGPPSPIRKTAVKRSSSALGSPKKFQEQNHQQVRPLSAVDPYMMSKQSSASTCCDLTTSIDERSVLEQLRPYRIAIIRRMQVKQSERGSLQRLHGILSGRKDDEGDNIREQLLLIRLVLTRIGPMNSN